ncbi:MAG: efflux RND transporter permease subunit, partial [Lentisphaeria bacterium]
TVALLLAGFLVAPFDWNSHGIQRYPIPVDAIPDIGENQQIVFTAWNGRSPQDVEDQVTYPLSVQLLAIPGVKTLRSYSMFGFSSIYVIFKENVEFYWSRARVLEKINSLPTNTLPENAKPTLGPDATALGQIFWYTLEGLDPEGKPTGGWDLEEIRTAQDWYLRYWLLAAEGVADVASVGGYQREYQIDVDPDAMQAYGVNIEEVYEALRDANIDVGAKSIEFNRSEYFIRSKGFIKSLDDIENSVVKVNEEQTPVLVKHIANVSMGPASRDGALDKEGAPVVGASVIARYADNPLQVINNVKKKIEETRDSLPAKAVISDQEVSASSIRDFAFERGFEAYVDGRLNQEDWLAYLRRTPREDWPHWLTLSRLTVLPFYDRSALIYETLGTLNQAIVLEIIITMIVVLFMAMHLRSGLIISSMLPLAVLFSFVGMKLFKVQANIVALSGIAIAIGTIVDMGIVICENILRHLEAAKPGECRRELLHRAAAEVGGAVLTAVLTTVVSFLPVFTMQGAEGKLFKPLAYTKTFALIASIIIALTLLPAAADLLLNGKVRSKKLRQGLNLALMAAGLLLAWKFSLLAGAALALWGLYGCLEPLLPPGLIAWSPRLAIAACIALLSYLLTLYWEPLGPAQGLLRNFFFTVLLIGGFLALFRLYQYFYPAMLAWCLRHKALFLAVPGSLCLFALLSWLGYTRCFAWLPAGIHESRPAQYVARLFPGLGKEFMPDLDEGSFLFMPTTMPHASIGEVIDIMTTQDIAFNALPEIESVVGKLGRAETPLDPAPVSMLETVINYKSEYKQDKNGRRINYKYEKGDYVLDEEGQLIPDPKGRPFRQWREHIRNPDDIWHEIIEAAKLPGTSSAPKLQPIAARIVMLQSGMRAPMGVKVKGPSLDLIESVGLEIEKLLKEVPGVEPSAVIADRIVGKPYLEIMPDRLALARYGISVAKFQNIVEIAIGGKQLGNTVERRERFPIRVRYSRELRDSVEALLEILVPANEGRQIPLRELAQIQYKRGPQELKSEDSFLVGYVVFDKQDDIAEVDLVQRCQAYLQGKIDSGEFILPPGVSYVFSGSYENQLRAAGTLALVLPIALFIIFMIIYFEFRSLSSTMLIFSGVFVSWSGGFLLIWLYAQPWFLDFDLFGTSMRALFQVQSINLSVAVWVGFLALFGIATDDGVVMGTYLTQLFRENQAESKDEIRRLVQLAGQRRVRACLMTTATTVLALIPVLCSSGRGSDIMVPMAIPSFGGMFIEVITTLVVPVLYCLVKEIKAKTTTA